MLAASLAVTLVGCGKASISSKPVEDYKGEVKGVDAPASSAGGAPWAAWTQKSGDEFAITMYGSSDCPPVASGYKVKAPDEVSITLKSYPAAQGCEQDYAAHTTVFQTPSNMDRWVTIQFTAQGVHFYLSPVKKAKK